MRQQTENRTGKQTEAEKRRTQRNEESDEAMEFAEKRPAAAEAAGQPFFRVLHTKQTKKAEDRSGFRQKREKKEDE